VSDREVLASAGIAPEDPDAVSIDHRK
jgi:hypothetical protein